MEFLVVQFLTGLASAASLFLAASGLSIIFGVTRIVNFAHGAFYMLGAYVAVTLTEWWAGPLGFWGGILVAALFVAVLGALTEILLLRRIYRSPELFQLLATFGVTLMMQDIVLLVWGPVDLIGPRAPGFRGAVDILGQAVPTYELFLIALGPVVLAVLWLLFHRTRWGVLVRAATQDRDMVAALGVNQKWLFTSVFALGIFLAALGGALQLPREAASHNMDLRIIVEVFVVVVIGGLGSVTGAFLAAVLVSELNAFGILILPKISLVLVFLVMAAVLVVRPWGLFGRKEGAARQAPGATIHPWRPLRPPERLAVAGVLAAAACLPFFAGNYLLTVGSEILIFALFAQSLQLLMTVGGLASFGHAAYFGLGSYGAALAAKSLGLPMGLALLAGPLLALAGACLFGWFAVRLAGVYFADADARLRPDRLVGGVPVGRGHGRRQRDTRRLAGRLGRHAGAVLLAELLRHRRGRFLPARAHLLAVRLCAAGDARLRAARRSDRHRSRSRPADGVHDRRRASPELRARCSPT